MSFNFSTYEITLAICFILIFIIIKFGKNIKASLLFSVIILSVLAFFFDPVKAWKENGNYTDLYRFFYDMDLINLYGLNIQERLLTNYDVIPITKILIVIISKIGINNLLPAVVAFVYYGAFAKTLSLLYEREKIELKIIKNSYIFFILISNFQLIITNIRIPLGSAILTLILYYDFIKNCGFKKCIIFYLLLIGIHPFFAMVILLRIIYCYKNKYTNKFIYVTLILYCLGITIFVNIINRYTTIGYFNFLLDKIDFYTNGSADKYFDRNNFIIDITRLVTLIIYLIYINKNNTIKMLSNDSFYKIYDFSKIACFFAIGSLGNMTIFNRFGNFLNFLTIVIYIIYNHYKLKENKKLNKFEFFVPNIIFYLLICMQTVLLFFGYQYQILCF